MTNPVASSGDGFYRFSIARVKENLVEPLRGYPKEMKEITQFFIGCVFNGRESHIFLFEPSFAKEPGFKALKEKIHQIGKNHTKEYETLEIPPPQEHPEYPYQFRVWQKGSPSKALPDRYTKEKPMLRFN